MFGGFGNNQQQQQQPAFGQQQQPGLFGQQQQQQQPAFGFGAQQQQQPGAFGTTPAFGQQPQQQSAFGAAPTGGFGAAPTAFGQQQQRPAFGAAQTGTSLFGSTATTQPSTGFGFGGAGTTTFGATNTGNTGFGSNPSTSLFGASTQPSTGGFGGAGTSAFGGTTSTFGAPATNTFGGGAVGTTGNQTSAQANHGTGNPPFQAIDEKVVNPTATMPANAPNQAFQNLGGMAAYQNWSFEELRLQDYMMNKKFSSNQQQSGFGGFGAGTSTFGTTNTGFGAPATTAAGTGLFGQQPTQSAFGQQPQQQTGLGFGQTSTAPTTGLFGQQPAATAAPGTGLFGATGTSAFGTTTTATPFGQQQPATSGFGTSAFGQSTQPKPAFGFGATPATTQSAFGATTTGLGGATGGGFSFGQPATTKPAFGTFGATTTPATGTSLFGQTSTAPATSAFGGAGGGLFGNQPKPATSGFGFGASTSTPAFGATTSAPATGLFGGAATSAPGMFSTPAPQQSTGLFGGGGTTGGGFGATTGGFGATTGGFGATTGGGLFTSSAPRPAVGGFGFGTSTQAAAAPTSGFNFGQQLAAAPSLFGGNTAQTGAFGASTSSNLFGGASLGTGTNTLGFGGLGQSTNQAQQPVLHAAIDKDPYGINPLFQSSAQGTAAATGPTVMAPPSEKKKPALTPHYKVAPQSASKIKLRGIGVSPMKKGPGLESPRGFSLFDGTSNDKIMAGLDSRFTPRKSAKKLELFDEPSGPFTPSPGKETPRKGVTFVDDSILNESTAPDVTSDSFSNTPSILKTPTPAGRVRPQTSPAPDNLQTPSPASGSTSQNTPGSAKTPKSPARASDYEVSPSWDELVRLSEDELREVQDFTVKLKGVGQVRFLEPVDLLQVSPTGTIDGIRQIPGKIIILEPKRITVYPDEDKKDPEGAGVNRPAEVQLEKCWPLDRVTKQPITDATDPRVDKHARKLEVMQDTEWLGYKPETGTWKFRVQHFSKYGLPDDSDDEEEVQIESVKGKGKEIASDGPQRQQQKLATPDNRFRDTFRDRKPRQWVDLAAQQSDGSESEDASGEGPVEHDNAVGGSSFEVDSQEDGEGIEDEVEVDESEEVEYAEEEYGGEHSFEEGAEEDDEDQLMSDDAADERESVSADELAGSGREVGEFGSRTNFAQARNVQNFKRVLSGGFQYQRAVPQTRSVPLSADQPARFPAAAGISDTMSTGSGWESPITPGKRARSIGQSDDEMASPFDSFPRRRQSFGEQAVPDLSNDEEDNEGAAVSPSPKKYAKAGKTVVETLPGSESVTFGKETSFVDAGLAMGRSFRVGWGPGGNFVLVGRSAGSNLPGKISIRKVAFFGGASVPDGGNPKRNTGAVALERKRHEQTLRVILANTIIVNTLRSKDGGTEDEIHEDEDTDDRMETDEDETDVIPKANVRKSLDFGLLADAVTKADRINLLTASVSQESAFSTEEADMWKLATALWDELYRPDVLNNLNPEQRAAFLEGQRREAIGRWLKDAVKQSVEKDVGKIGIGGIDTVFAYLSGRQIGNAVMTAVKERDFRLATVLSQLGGANASVDVKSRTGEIMTASGHGAPARGGTSDSVAQYLEKQVDWWLAEMRKTGKEEIGADYLRVWKLIAGNIGKWGPEVFERLKGDWKRAFGLFFWYGGGGGWGVAEALEQYENARAAPIARPLPKYLEGKENQRERQNVAFHLLKLFVDKDQLKHALQPLNVGTNPLNHRVSWLLHTVLWLAKGKHGFVDDSIDEGSERKPFAGLTADKLTLGLVDQLENLGEWTWAVFVALFLTKGVAREGVIKSILARWCSLEDTPGSWWIKMRGKAGEEPTRSGQKSIEDWKFLTEELKIPVVWIHEARALRAKYEGDVWQEAISLIDAKQFSVAHRIIMTQIAPDAIISRNFELFERLLNGIPEDKVPYHHRTIGLLKTYINIMTEIPKLVGTIDAPYLARPLLTENAETQEAREYAETVRREAIRNLAEWKQNLKNVLNEFADGVVVGDGVVGRVCVGVMCGNVVRACGDFARVQKMKISQLVTPVQLLKLPLPEDERSRALRKVGNEVLMDAIAP
ncbi:hypothetical protein HK097_003102 [Rhizophlyctis rosea]|uniref:Peptidase S59 domain-containing protein n=1 Tax=Rhizophlyctis rosea TaxID=64517 RepID=A0AAD5X6X8_9FUNG|nr:hypothetical protein HK097_003102 [Rhizophlyctis rosea]